MTGVKEGKRSEARGHRSVSSILARQRRRRERHRQVFPPDFIHGNVAVADIYTSLGAPWVERALFVIDDAEVTTVAHFDDYFLIVEHVENNNVTDRQQWWSQKFREHDRIVALGVEEDSDMDDEVAVKIDVDRRRLHQLERDVLGVVREGMTGRGSLKERRCRGELDVLSLVTLTGRLTACQP